MQYDKRKKGEIILRVIAGKARHIILKTPKGLHTRPTTDRIKETLFNIMQCLIPDSIFLDLYSGSGAIGIEALSRGAKRAIFVEKDRQACKCIQENLIATKLIGQAQILQMDVAQALRVLEGKKEQITMVFLDPPYERGLEEKTLAALDQFDCLQEEAVVIVEASQKTDIAEEYFQNLTFWKKKIYGRNQHLFFRKMRGTGDENRDLCR